MVLSINPSIPVIAAPSVGTATDKLVLPQGAVVTAQVQKVLASDLVQIAIGKLTLEVATEVPLRAGQILQLAMAQSDQGVVRLAIVNQDQVEQDQAEPNLTTQGQATQGQAAPGQTAQSQAGQGQIGQGQIGNVNVAVDDGVETPAVIVSPALANNATPQLSDPLTPMQRMAVSVATEQAVMQQASQGQLFADLNAVVSSPNLPPALRAAISQVLAQQTPLSPDLTGGDIRNALQSSGLVLEASLAAAAAAPMAATNPATAPSSDLKAALIVLRQILGSVLQTTDGAQTPATPSPTPAPSQFKAYSPPPPVSTPQPLLPSPQSFASQQSSSPQQAASSPQPFSAQPQASSQSSSAPQQTASSQQSASASQSTTPQPSSSQQAPQQASSQQTSSERTSMPSPSLVPEEFEGELMPDGDQQSTPLPQGRTAAFESTLLTGSATDGLAERLAKAEPHSLTPSNVLTLLQGKDSSRTTDFGAQTRVTTADGQTEEVIVRTNLPPPPYRGSLPSAQAMALPMLSADAPLSKIVRRLLGDTNAALSRQTLLQVASLPERPDAPGARNDPTMPRWNFEIPFATQQGTAMAQFEISRDSNAGSSDEAKRVWRARFSLDVEPAGPVHALISLIGERASVRMWAERPNTARQLRAGSGDLSLALSEAALTPGDIVVHEGMPPAVALPKAGHFLDRAT